MKITKIVATVGIGLFFLLLLASEAAGFEDTCERYPNGTYTDYWVFDNDGSPNANCHVTYDNSWSTTVLRLDCYTYYDNDRYINLKTAGYIENPTYFSFVTRNVSTAKKITVEYRNATTNAVVASGVIPQIKSNTKYECVWGASDLKVYENGTLISTSSVSLQPNMLIDIMAHVGGGYYGVDTQDITLDIDDITTSSTIGIPEVITEANTYLPFTWSAEYMRSYSTPYTITLYSLSNPTNAGKIKAWNISSDADSSDKGYINESRNSLLGDSNFGLYLLEMTRGNDVLTDQYFYYDQLSNPQGFPEILFVGESSVAADIRDEDMNGGEVAAGGSAYLYPDINENGDYTFTYNILETPYAISTEFATSYNTTAINSTTLSYSGLSGMDYNISVDGAAVGRTEGSDTFTYMFSGPGVVNNHIIAFSPDYSVTGIYGTVKDSVTQKGIKSATVSIVGNSSSHTLYTDDNGLFYLTEGMSAGQTYTVSVSKVGYTAPPSQTSITVAGSTTRQDFFVDPKESTSSGSGLYYSAHYVAVRVVKNEAVQNNITIVSYANGNATATSTNVTGYNGIAGFEMTQNIPYKLEFYEADGTTLISSVDLYPTGDYYTFDPWGIASGKAVITSYSTKWLNSTFGYIPDTKTVALYYNVTQGTNQLASFTVYKDGQPVYTSNSTANSNTFSTTVNSTSNYNVVFTIKNSDGRTYNTTFPVALSHQLPTGYSPFSVGYPQWLKNTFVVGFAIVCLCFVGGAFSFYGLVMALLVVIGGWYMGILQFEGTPTPNISVIISIIAGAAVAAYLKYKRISGE